MPMWPVAVTYSGNLSLKATLVVELGELNEHNTRFFGTAIFLPSIHYKKGIQQ